MDLNSEENNENNENSIHDKFIKKYPNVNYDNLINLKSLKSIGTRDGREHYVDKTTNIVYSYDYHFNKKWDIMSKSYQDKLLNIYGYYNENCIHDKFIKKYPNVNYDNLINLGSLKSIITMDGCDHYVDKTSNIVYSYDNDFNKEWDIMSKSYQDELLNIYGYYD